MAIECPICGHYLSDSHDACERCGYKLTGSTRSFKPIDMSDTIVPHTSTKRPNESFLRVLRGQFLDTIFPLGDKTVTIGRSPKCDICLNDMTVSRSHAQIVPSNNGFVIEDLHSFNGVWVNNKSISSHLLKQGDIVQLGAFCLRYQEV